MSTSSTSIQTTMKVRNTASVVNVQKLYKNTLLSDIEFVFENKLSGKTSKVAVTAHKCILAASSVVFERMFSEDWKEEAFVTITDASFEAFCEFLQFFYVEEIELTEANIVEVFKLVDKYDMKECLVVCERLLRETVSTELTCLYYDLALEYNFSSALIKKFEQAISSRATEVLKSWTFKTCSPGALRRILQMEVLKCKENDIFIAAMAWAMNACEANECSTPSDTDLKTALGDCFELIRFPLLTVQQFADCYEKYPNLFKHCVYCDILQYILKKRPLSIAENFSTVQRKNLSIDISFMNSKIEPITGRGSDFSRAYAEDSKSCISFKIKGERSISLLYCDIILSNTINVNSLSIQHNRLVIEFDREIREIQNSRYGTRFAAYRLYLKNPLVCEPHINYSLIFSVNSFSDAHFMFPFANMVVDDIPFEFYNTNYIVTDMHFE